MTSFIILLTAVFILSFVGQVIYYMYDINKKGYYAANIISQYPETKGEEVSIVQQNMVSMSAMQQQPQSSQKQELGLMKETIINDLKNSLKDPSLNENSRNIIRGQLKTLTSEEYVEIFEKGYDERRLKKALTDLDNQVGMDTVKCQIKDIVNSKLHILERRRQGKVVKDDYCGNILFTGNAGTGKSTLAKIMGEIIVSLGYADGFYSSNKEDYVEGIQGASTKKTLNLLNMAMQNRRVVFVDEMYSLVTDKQDSVGLEAVNTIVKYIEENKNLVLIGAGYKKEMIDFLNTNTGLKSRFKHELQIQDYNNSELVEIALRMIRGKGYRLADEKAVRALKQVIKQENIMPEKSGNARLARNIIEKAIERQGSRCYSLKLQGDYLDLLIADDFQIAKESEKTLQESLEELNKFIGMNEVKQQVNELIAVAQHNKEMDDRGHQVNKLSLHTVFTGNPGTGKTTVARVLGDIYKAMGMLPKGHVVEVSRQDLVASYVGQTAEKTKNVIEQALGGILFIDEAYTLSCKGDNDFGGEAIDCLLKSMEDYRDNLMVIVAGYDKNMEGFLESNVGLSSRFNNNLHFEDYAGEELMQIFSMFAKNEGYILSPEAREYLEGKFETMYLTRDVNFGNGRDVRNIFEATKRKMAVRLQKILSKSEEDCVTITIEDVNSQ